MCLRKHLSDREHRSEKCGKGSQAAQAVCLPGRYLLFTRGGLSNVQSFSFLVLEGKHFLEPRIKERHVEQAVFSLGDKDGKGTVPCGSE